MNHTSREQNRNLNQIESIKDKDKHKDHKSMEKRNNSSLEIQNKNKNENSNSQKCELIDDFTNMNCYSNKKKTVNFGFSQLYVNPSKIMINNNAEYGLFVKNFDNSLHSCSKVGKENIKKIIFSQNPRNSGVSLNASKNPSEKSLDISSRNNSAFDEESRKHELSPTRK